MSWKAVELQVAIPRTQDAGKIQEQLQQRSQAAQDRMAAVQEKEHKKERTQVTNKQETNKNHFEKQKDGETSRESCFTGENRKAKKEENETIDHPYKGKKIDYTG
ncbi:hypothetical protein [Alteribacillus sp. YIM 98480]|uniref:hypothetical protein n=1 Tax=Alteribacillus sp. YIM 98480 TaxID=2606599 RepID=UPI00131DE596|nr:hypothetical protein [Alteribacillus sp. YIM 98480]